MAKISDFRSLGSALLKNPSLNQAQKILRDTIFAHRWVGLGRAHERALQVAVIKVLHSLNFSLHHEVRESVKLRSSLLQQEWSCKLGLRR